MIRYNGNHWIEGLVKKLDKKHDLALIEVDAYIPAAPLYYGRVMPGEKEAVAGAPLGDLLSVTEGRVSGFANEQGWQGTAPIYPGNSGGGSYVFRNHEWELYGIIESVDVIDEQGFPPQFAAGVSFAIPIELMKF